MLHNYDELREVTQIHFTALIQQVSHLSCIQSAYRRWGRSVSWAGGDLLLCPILSYYLYYPYEYRGSESEVFSLPQGKLTKQRYYPKPKPGLFYSNCKTSKYEQQPMNKGSKSPLRSPSELVSVCYIYTARNIHKVSILCHWKGILQKKLFLKKQKTTTKKALQCSNNWKTSKGTMV